MRVSLRKGVVLLLSCCGLLSVALLYTTGPALSATPIVDITASDSSDDGHIPSNAIDGDLSTRWSAKGKGQWIQFALSSPQILDGLNIAWYKGDTRVEKFTIKVSLDQQKWTTLFEGKTSGQTAGFQLFNVKSTSCQYIQIVGNKNSDNGWNSISEVQFLFEEPTTPPVIPPVIPPTPPTTPSPGNATYPAQVLDLTNWKVTLPTGKPGSPTEITQPALATYTDANFCVSTDSPTGVVFTAACGGVTTSGSSYPRSELREMSGKSLAAWGSNDGLTHTMDFTGALLMSPIVKPQVVVGQVHDASDDVIEIEYFGLGVGKLYAKYNDDKSMALARRQLQPWQAIPYHHHGRE
jgi:poly(beta-D-mannuronate) lyase